MRRLVPTFQRRWRFDQGHESAEDRGHEFGFTLAKTKLHIVNSVKVYCSVVVLRVNNTLALPLVLVEVQYGTCYFFVEWSVATSVKLATDVRQRCGSSSFCNRFFIFAKLAAHIRQRRGSGSFCNRFLIFRCSSFGARASSCGDGLAITVHCQYKQTLQRWERVAYMFFRMIAKFYTKIQ